MRIDLASRIKKLPPYLFADLEEKIKRKKDSGYDILSFGVGDPDMSTPQHIINALFEAAKDSKNHRYPTYEGMLDFRQAVATRYKKDHSLEFDPEKEVMTLIGSKEGIHNIHFAFIESGDIVLYSDPGYPVYSTGPLFAGGKGYAMPLLKENDFLPDLEAIPGDVAKKAKMMWINYPNNPTTAVAGKEFYKEVVDFASDNDIMVCSDEAYSKIAFEGYNPMSFLEIDGARDVGIVFNSLSKTYNMAGWRLGYAVGNEDIVAGLKKVKTNIDSGVPQIIQKAGIAALASSQECVHKNVKAYRERRDILVSGLKGLGLKCQKPRATFYVWLEVPDRDSMKFADALLDKASIVITPGVGFGKSGEGFVRLALTLPIERIREALERMERVGF